MCFAQAELQVRLTDSESGEAISYATVRFKNTSRGLVADYYGEFRLPYTALESLPLLVITSLGYESLEIDPKELSSAGINSLEMKPQIEQLDAVVLNISKRKRLNNLEVEDINFAIKEGRRLLAFEIVQKAIDAITANLSQKPHSYIGYYRDYQTLGKGEYYNLNEGIIEHFDGGIFSQKIRSLKNRSALYFFKQNKNFPIDENLALAYDNKTKYLQNADVSNYGGNELSILRVHNPIRIYNIKSFSWVYRMDQDFIKNHIFEKGKIEFNDNQPIMTITFENRREISNGIHSSAGTIKISLIDYAIYSFRYTMSDENDLNPLFNIDIQYRKINDHMYPNYMTFNNRFILKDDDVFREDYVWYDKDNNSFNIRFNRNVNPKSLKSRKFKIYFKNKRLRITELEIIDKRNVKLNIAQTELGLSNLDEDSGKDFKLVIKNIRDEDNSLIYEQKHKIAYQFREFFVQEVFENKAQDPKLYYVDKLRPLSHALVNKNFNIENYIINSPLKNRQL
jgi:hypothetical protein